jgi:anti-sigma B factor antagonist
VPDVTPATGTRRDVHAVIRLPAEIDIVNAEETGRELRAALRPGVTAVIADMTQTSFAGSSAIRALLETHDRAAANQIELRVVIPAGPVLRAVKIIGLDGYLRIYPSLDAALTDWTLSPAALPPGWLAIVSESGWRGVLRPAH